MSSAANELKEVKSIVRGLLISSTLATTIRYLETDYRKEVGCDIPYQKLGYPSTEAFLRSIPDTVCLKEPHHGCPSNMIIVQPVQSKKSDHVEKLVIRQKKAPNAMRGMKRASAVSSHLSLKRASSSSSNPNGLPPSFVPMSLRVALNRVCQRYAQQGLPLSSLAEELSNDLYMAGWLLEGKSGWLSTFGFRRIEDVIEAFIENRLIKVGLKNGNKWIIPDQKPVEEHVIPAGQEDDSDDDFNDFRNTISLVSDKMKSNFKAIMRRHPDGLWCSSLPLAYKDLTGFNLDVKELGFVSIIQMASQLKDVFICSRPNSNSDWLLFDAESNSVWNSPAAPIAKETKMATLPLNIIHNVEALLQEYPSGIMKHKFLLVYKAKYNEELPMADYGFDNMMSLLAHLASRNVIHLKFFGNMPMICSPFINREEDVSLKELSQENDFINALYPRGVMMPHDDIPIQPFPENFSCGCSIDVLVTEITTPSLFWFQLWGSEIQEDFNAMMDNLQVFYDPGGPADHRMPDATILIGQFCAARFPPEPSDCGEWHRARITSLPSLTDVEVLYIDYGSKSRVLRSEIRFLATKFSYIPMLAHKACLVNIRPYGYGLWLQRRRTAIDDLLKRKPTWSADASNAFLKMVENQPLVGVVANVDPDKVSFALIDTSKETDRHINDLLVYAKKAEFGEMSEKDDLMFNDLMRPSSSQSTYEMDGKMSNEEEDGIRSPGLRPPSAERSNAPDTNEGVRLGHVGELPSRTTISPMSEPCSVERSRFGPDTNGEDYLGHVKDFPSRTTISPMPEQHSVERSRFGPDTSGGDRFGHVGELPPRTAISPMPESSSVKRGRFGPDMNGKIHLGQAGELPKNATSPMPEQYSVKENIQAVRQEEMPNFEAKNFQDKMMREAHLQVEIEKVKLYQQQLQYQQLHNQLLFLAAQNSFMAGCSVPNPLLCGQVIPPPPGLSNVNPLMNAQANVSDLISRALISSGSLPGLQTPFLPSALPLCGNFPIGNFGGPQFMGTAPFDKPQFMGSGESSPRVSTPPHPPGFEHKVAGSASPVNTLPASPILPVPSVSSTLISSRNVSEEPGPEIKLKEADHVPQKSSDSVVNVLSKDEEISESVHNLIYSEKKVVLNDKGASLLPVGTPDENKVKSLVEAKRFSDRKVEDTFEALHASLEACYISDDSNSSVTDDLKKKTDSQLNNDLREEDKWKVNIDVLDDDEDKGDIFKGTVNGKTVHIVKFGYFYYVLTEEILGLFYNSLPVHVALKIANLRPNGNKIDCIIINPRKNREMCKNIQRLGAIEVHPNGSDIHLTSVESLHYLCTSLGNTD